MDKQYIVPAALAVIITVVIVFIIVRHYKRNQHFHQISKLIKDLSHKSLRNILLPDSVDEKIWVDCLLLTDGGLIVLDIRDYVGRLFGGDNINEWTQIIGVKSHKFSNPLLELPARINAVQEIADDIPVIGHIVFTRRGAFEKGKPEGVYMVDEVYEQLSHFLRPALSADKLDKVWRKILSIHKPG